MILTDEPTGSLDSATGADVIELLAGLAARQGNTILVAAHDAELASQAPRRLPMRDGRLVSEFQTAAALEQLSRARLSA